MIVNVTRNCNSVEARIFFCGLDNGLLKAPGDRFVVTKMDDNGAPIGLSEYVVKDVEAGTLERIG